MPELRITAIINIPDGPFEGAEAMVAAKPVVDTLEQGVVALGGTVKHELVQPRTRASSAAEA